MYEEGNIFKEALRSLKRKGSSCEPLGPQDWLLCRQTSNQWRSCHTARRSFAFRAALLLLLYFLMICSVRKTLQHWLRCWSCTAGMRLFAVSAAQTSRGFWYQTLMCSKPTFPPSFSNLNSGSRSFQRFSWSQDRPFCLFLWSLSALNSNVKAVCCWWTSASGCSWATTPSRTLMKTSLLLNLFSRSRKKTPSSRPQSISRILNVLVSRSVKHRTFKSRLEAGPVGQLCAMAVTIGWCHVACKAFSSGHMNMQLMVTMETEHKLRNQTGVDDTQQNFSLNNCHKLFFLPYFLLIYWKIWHISCATSSALEDM